MPVDSTSFSLLRRLQLPDDQSAWVQFVDVYGPLIFYWARKKGLNSTDAGELLQDVLAVLVAKLPTFSLDPAQRFRGWLRTITVNRAIDLYRRNRRMPQSAGDDLLNRLEAIEPGEFFDEAEYRSLLVHRTLELLRTEFRPATWQAGWLQLVQGQKAAEVARQLDLPLNTVYLAKSRLLARLREELDGLME